MINKIKDKLWGVIHEHFRHFSSPFKASSKELQDAYDRGFKDGENSVVYDILKMEEMK